MEEFLDLTLSDLGDDDVAAASTPKPTPTPDGECASSACSTSKTADAPGKSKRLPSFIRKSMQQLLLTDFFDNVSENTFGAMKKGEYLPASDFLFDLVTEVICDVPSSSGYLVNLTPAHSNVTR